MTSQARETPPVVVDDEVRFDLDTLSRACHCSVDVLVALIDEGVIEPEGASGSPWSFSGPALERARIAVRLSRDLEINPPGVALAMELLQEIRRLESR